MHHAPEQHPEPVPRRALSPLSISPVLPVPALEATLALVAAGHTYQAVTERRRSVLVALRDMGVELPAAELRRIDEECVEDCGRPRCPKLTGGGFRSERCPECRARRDAAKVAARNRAYRRRLKERRAQAAAAGGEVTP